MSSVVHFEDYVRRWRVPPLVFLDVYSEQLRQRRQYRAEHFEPVLEKCRLLLEHARTSGWPVGFVTPIRHSTGCNNTGRDRWIGGIEPRKEDMVFERSGASCYSSREFADAMSDAGGVFVLAGFSGECSCLSTMIDAARAGHHTGFVIDASATRPLPGRSAQESHHALIAAARRYATLVTARLWISVARKAQSNMVITNEYRPNRSDRAIEDYPGARD